LLENNFIKLSYHTVSPSPLELKERKYCKWHNSFNHNTSDCNIFHQFIQSAIDTGRLRFAQTQEDDQLATIGFDGKGSLNWLVPAGLSKDSDSIAKEEYSKLPSDEKDIVHDLQNQNPRSYWGQSNFSISGQEPATLPVLETQVRPVQTDRSDQSRSEKFRDVQVRIS
jgi:hypothetical protein